MEPCLCGDPECPACFPGNPAWQAHQYRRALSRIANSSAGDYRRAESDADYWHRFSRELQEIARDTLDHV